MKQASHFAAFAIVQPRGTQLRVDMLGVTTELDALFEAAEWERIDQWMQTHDKIPGAMLRATARTRDVLIIRWAEATST